MHLDGQRPDQPQTALAIGEDAHDVGRRLSFWFKRSSMLVTGMRIAVPARPAGIGCFPAYGATIPDEGHREHASGQADKFDEPRARVSSWPPLRPTRLRRERGSVVVVSPTAPIGRDQERSSRCDG